MQQRFWKADMAEPKYYWLAIRGPRVVPAPSWMTPLSRTMMVQASIAIGRNPSEPTLWTLDTALPVPADQQPEHLIGYETEAARQASFELLLNAPIAVARKEFRRIAREEFVIPGQSP
jgi:hypothetical protein